MFLKDRFKKSLQGERLVRYLLFFGAICVMSGGVGLMLDGWSMFQVMDWEAASFLGKAAPSFQIGAGLMLLSLPLVEYHLYFRD